MSGFRVANTTIHVTVLLQISLHYVRFHTRFALPMSMAAPLWRMVCQTKSNRIQAVAQELVKISLFYIYMNRYLHIKVFSFVPKLDLTFRIGHMSENISYYGLLQPIRYKHKYNANIRIRIGFWVANIRIQFFVFVSALFCIQLPLPNIFPAIMTCLFPSLDIPSPMPLLVYTQP